MASALDALRVLVVEDNDADAELVGRWLLGAGYAVVRVNLLAGAVWVLSTNREFAVVLLDLGLPDGEGVDAVRKMIAVLPEGALLIACSGAPEAWLEVTRDCGVPVYDKRDCRSLVALLGACRSLGATLGMATTWL